MAQAGGVEFNPTSNNGGGGHIVSLPLRRNLSGISQERLELLKAVIFNKKKFQTASVHPWLP